MLRKPITKRLWKFIDRYKKKKKGKHLNGFVNIVRMSFEKL